MSLNNRTRILIVDDQADLRMLIKLTFGAARYLTVEAANAAEALAAVDAGVPDVVLIDVMMPGIGGYELCSRLRADPRCARTVLVLMTAGDQATERRLAADAGGDHYLPKPFRPSLLPPLVDGLLRSKRGES